jgi:hypothetical protein
VPTTRPAPDRYDEHGPRFDLRGRRRAYAAVAGALVLVAIAGVWAYNAFSSAPEFSFKNYVVESSGPWRLHIFSDAKSSEGCNVTVTDLDQGSKSTVPASPAYGESMWQMQSTGRFRLERSQPGCGINAEDGAGDESGGQKVIRGDSEGFNPSGTFTVHVDDGDFTSEPCVIILKDGDTGTIVDQVSLTRQSATQEMEPGPRSSVYVWNVPCPVTINDD